ncbi:MAG: DUF2917 domain-containing protein [Gammaproteobacteria bacterium]|uniref:DUF2917 domain-containing protein n=1 Tax=Azohydromonas sp. TaxID=1872666 RepID=UPI002BC120D9|nr:DUF2917 domain-containing protein [Azohydromonas sp.]HMM85455.1 DUF2917 domain-containing protein [Azohydromonas sp.]
MNPSMMHDSQQSGDRLLRQQVRRLRRAARARRLVVRQGLLWVTPTATLERPATDRWVAAGDALDLAPGVEWLVQAWTDTDFELLDHPATAPAGRASWVHWLHRRWRARTGAGAPAPCPG